jgi:hypothetical protein
MELTQRIQDALSAAGFTDNFTLSSPDDRGGITVKPATDDDQIASAQDALKTDLPPSDYITMVNRSVTDPCLYVRPQPAGS